MIPGSCLENNIGNTFQEILWRFFRYLGLFWRRDALDVKKSTKMEYKLLFELTVTKSISCGFQNLVRKVIL